MSGQKGQRKNRAIILNELWDAGIPVETSYKVSYYFQVDKNNFLEILNQNT